MSFLTIIIILLLLGCFGSYPGWGYSRSWGYGPFGGLGLLLLVVIVVLFMRR